MDATGDDQLTQALRDFVERIGEFDPSPRPRAAAEIEVRCGAGATTFQLSLEVAQALAAALRAYHDPRDQGRCERCGGVRLDDYLVCVDCGRPHGIFGQLLLERAARYEGEAPDTARRPAS